MRLAGPALASAVVVGLALLGACGKGDAKKPAGGAPGSAGREATGPGEGTSEEDALIAKYRKWFDFPPVTYTWDRNAGDKSVPAELGGPGFTGEGWTTRLTIPNLGWPDAPKGGSLRIAISDWPATLRLWGENSNSGISDYVESLCTESLLGFHSGIMDYVPNLATHWWISDDKMTFRFRLNPEARWSDGTEVTAEDVVASWKLRMDPKMRFPSDVMVFGKFEEPVAKSKYLVEVKCKEENWRNFLYFSGMSILPAASIKIPGDVYLDKYQNAYTPMSGGYTILPEDVKMGQSIALTRRKDYWGEKNPALGGGNIDKFVFEVVKDANLGYEKVKKGELDFYPVPRALWWAKEIPEFESVKRGLLVMKKIYNDAPIGTNGYAINMLKAPLDDVRIRKALQLLYNRRLMIEKIMFNEYEPLTSYHQGGIYSNADNKEFPYDPVAAVELLEQAGWKDFNEELYRVKDGKVLKFELVYQSQLSEKVLVIYQEDCKKAGIKIDLKLLTPASHWKSMTQKEFELADMGWTGLFFPNPETSWMSELADQTSNNNIVGFKNPRVDELCREYDKCYDVARRIEIIREIDGILYGTHPYVLGWYNPSQRFLYWNKFGMPPWGSGRTARVDQIWMSMWVDPEKEKALEEARKDPTKTMPREEEKNFFWRAWNAEQRRKDKEKAGGK